MCLIRPLQKHFHAGQALVLQFDSQVLGFVEIGRRSLWT